MMCRTVVVSITSRGIGMKKKNAPRACVAAAAVDWTLLPALLALEHGRLEFASSCPASDDALCDANSFFFSSFFLPSFFSAPLFFFLSFALRSARRRRAGPLENSRTERARLAEPGTTWAPPDSRLCSPLAGISHAGFRCSAAAAARCWWWWFRSGSCCRSLGPAFACSPARAPLLQKSTGCFRREDRSLALSLSRSFFLATSPATVERIERSRWDACLARRNARGLREGLSSHFPCAHV